MHRSNDCPSEVGFDQAPSFPGDAERSSQHGLRRSRSETYDYLRLDQSDLRIEPGSARPDFYGVRSLVDTAFSTRLPLEMLHDVGDVGLAAINARFIQSLIQDSSGPTNKGSALQILVIARLFAD